MSDVARRIAALSPERQALLAARLRASPEGPPRRESLAIVGIGCRFPGGADTPARFWRLLRDGVDAITPVPPDRWDADALYAEDPQTPGKMSTRWGGFLPGLDRFEPSFFGISPRETASLDPQQRLFLEVATEALEDAGQAPARLAGSRTGVYVGTHNNDYSWMLFSDAEALDAYASTGTARSIVANRLSYVLDLRGPSLTVDTACSASLVAVHLACQALRNDECDLALAGGVNLLLSPLWSVALSKLGMLSPDGRCRTFDAGANGIVRSEGCGVIVLKRLGDAVAAGDHVWAVIRGSATNQDGRTNGLTAPNGLAQQAVVRQALADGAVDPGEVGLVEAHGTGTPLGDPIEVEALAAVLGAGGRPCRLGSAKSNLGHLEAAAGIAGLIKVVLSLRHEAVPGLVHFRELNPHIDLTGTRLSIPTTLQPWPRGHERRVGGVSAFGFGGSNAHVVIEEAPLIARAAAEATGPHLLPLSARGADGLGALVRAYHDWLEDKDDTLDLAEACASAALRRVHHPHRLAVVGASREELVAGLAEAMRAETMQSPAPAPAGAGLAFVFSGQGTQWPGMGRDLLEREPVFRRTVQACDTLVRAEAGWSLLEVLDATRDGGRLERTEFAQPAIFAVQVGLAALLGSWGIVPAGVTGHSVGEIAAAHVAGALTLADAVRIVVHRGRLMQRAEGRGRMASVELGQAEAMIAIAASGERLSIAAVNAPTTTVLSGDGDALADVVRGLEGRGVACQWLPVTYAFHSAQMDPLRAPLVEILKDLDSARPGLPLVSSVTGLAVAAGDLASEYWGRNLRQPVRFAAAIETLADLGMTSFVEIGPHPVLGGAVARTLQARGRAGVALASLRRGQPADAAVLGLVGRLWQRGHGVDWSALYPGPRRWVSIPPTPWERESYPPRVGTPAAGRTAEAAQPGGHPLVARRLATAQPVYETRVDREAPAYLSDHRLHGVAILSATALIEMALHAGADALGVPRTRLEDLVITRAIPLDGARAIQLTVGTETADVGELRVFSRLQGDRSWELHATGRLRPDAATADLAGRDGLRAGEALRAGTPISDGEAHYERLRRRGADFGPAFRGVRRIWRGEGEALAEVELPSVLDGTGVDARIHPALLDACVQVVAGAVETDEATLLVPLAAESIRVYGAASRVWSHARLRPHADGITADIVVTDDAGTLIAELRGLAFRPTRRDTPSTPTALYELTWPARALAPSNGAAGGGRWLVLADRGGVGADLARRLESRGHTVTLRRADDGLPPTESWTGVVHLGALDVAARDGASALHADAVEVTAGALELVQRLATSTSAPRLWLVTRGAQPLGDGARDVALAQSALWGFGRAVALEHPELRPTLVDLDPADTASVEGLAAELLAGDTEPQVALRGGVRHVARLVPRPAADATTAPALPAGLRLDISARGVLDNLAWVPTPRTPPAPGQVAVEVEAIGLNFRDVLNALGMYPGDAGPLGSEFSGRVAALGRGVDTLAIGDRVMGVGTGTFATSVVTDAALVVAVPADLSTEAAAAIPIAFLTVSCALHELARLQRGQRVLIHAAAGGVGLAAVALARRVGAEVFATAGNADKRALLTSLGVAHVLDSRSLDFADDIHRLTGGRGVDVVLNSLTGEFIPASLRATSPGGCFVEIGKRGIWSPAQVAAARPDVAYHVLDLGELFEREPARIQTMLRALAADFAAGRLLPPPHRVYPAARAADAFRFMAQARHVGKLVVTPPASTASAAVRGDATYLVTGGLGALGLRTAEWLHARGARHLALMGRSAPAPWAAARLARLELDGTVVRVIQGDVAHDQDVAAALAAIARTLPPLRGVVHAAGVVDDGVVAGQSRASLDTVLAPKVAGSWNLHAHCASLPLDFFVLFSSLASVLGSAGQTNYAAANAVLDALAVQRRAWGQPALSVSWGPWSEGGMAASLAERDRKRWDDKGVRALSPSEALAGLERALAAEVAHVTIAAVDWRRYLRELPDGPGLTLAGLSERPAARAATAERPELLRRIDDLPVARRSAAVLAHVREQVMRVLQLAPNQTLDPERGLKDLGLDSLMAVELRNRLQLSSGRVLPTTLAFDHPTVAAIARYLDGVVLGLEAAEPTRPGPVGDADGLAESVERLSDEEAAGLLLEELARVREPGRERLDRG